MAMNPVKSGSQQNATRIHSAFKFQRLATWDDARHGKDVAGWIAGGGFLQDDFRQDIAKKRILGDATPSFHRSI